MRDPRKETLTAIGFNRTATEIVQAMRTADFIDRAISDDTAFWTEVTPILDDMLSRPMTEVIAQEAS